MKNKILLSTISFYDSNQIVKHFKNYCFSLHKTFEYLRLSFMVLMQDISLPLNDASLSRNLNPAHYLKSFTWFCIYFPLYWCMPTRPEPAPRPFIVIPFWHTILFRDPYFSIDLENHPSHPTHSSAVQCWQVVATLPRQNCKNNTTPASERPVCIPEVYLFIILCFMNI